jgi:23S rRNA pseudouridine1911/1915/1917 synthase
MGLGVGLCGGASVLKLRAEDVLYEDNHLLAVHKPAGVLVQGDASGEATLQDSVKAYLAEKYNKPGAVYLGLVHRLDRSVSGVVLFARTSKAAARLSEQIRERHVQKTYRAWVEGRVDEDSRELVHYLSEDDGYVRGHDKPGAGRKEARLGVSVLKREGERTLVEIDLQTGRKHQIRVQLSLMGHPVVGDTRYGAKARTSEGIALMSYRMRVSHPTTKATVEIVAREPKPRA